AANAGLDGGGPKGLAPPAGCDLTQAAGPIARHIRAQSNREPDQTLQSVFLRDSRYRTFWESDQPFDRNAASVLRKQRVGINLHTHRICREGVAQHVSVCLFDRRTAVDLKFHSV